MDDFMRSLTEQAYGNVYKKVLNENNPSFQTDPMGGGPQDPSMGGMGGDMGQDMGDGGMPEDPMGGGGIQLTGEQVAMLNQDLQGISQALQRLQSVLGGEIEPMGGGQDMDGMAMDDMDGNMPGDMQSGMPGGDAPGIPGPSANMMSRYSLKYMRKT